MVEACLAVSSLASTTSSSAPRAWALAVAASVIVTKNGLFKVDTEKPILKDLVAGADVSAAELAAVVGAWVGAAVVWLAAQAPRPMTRVSMRTIASSFFMGLSPF